MLDQYLPFLAGFEPTPERLAILGAATGVLFAFVGAASMVGQRNVAADRIAASARRATDRRDRGLLKPVDDKPSGLLKAFAPTDEKEQTALKLKLRRAGFSAPEAMYNYVLVRMLLAVGLPGIFLALLAAAGSPSMPLPEPVADYMSSRTTFGIFQWVTILLFLGYVAPTKWLDGRVKERSLKIEEAFPNALDLLQISVESGLAFDAAMTRVGNELARVSPEMAVEFLTVQRQIQAGRGRDEALKDMATRTGVDTVRSFANVVQQSIKFGTPMTEALAVYSAEMREYRQLKAQDMANKLPVKMSAVLASLMLPALVMLTVGPTVIRYIRYFAG